jgi:hypothetical protein
MVISIVLAIVVPSALVWTGTTRIILRIGFMLGVWMLWAVQLYWILLSGMKGLN